MKSKLKNVLLMGLSLVLVAAIAIGGTVAYLTDTDSDVNVMTVGNVQVKLQEKQRSQDGSELVDFVQGKELTPLVGSAQGTKDEWGQPSMEEASNYVDKIVYATNTGKNDAYIRFLVAIPTALIPDPENDQAPLHWNFGNRVDITGESKYNTVAYADSEWKKLFGEYDDVKDADGKAASVTIDGEEYWVTYFPMAETLAPGADSLAVMAGLYLDNRVDYDADRGVYTFNGQDINYDFSEGVKVPVMVQAVQAAGFKTADDAFTSAFGEITVANAESWFGGVKAPTVVSTADELTSALAEGGEILLQNGTYELAAGTAIPAGTSLVANGDNVTLTVPAPTTTNTSAITLGDNATLKGFKIVDDGNGIGMGDAGLITVNGANAVIEDCSFDITGTNATAIALGGGAVNTTIVGCDFVGGYKHIGPAPGTTGGIVIDDCTFNAGTYAIHLNATANDVVVKNSTIALFNTFFGHGNDAGELIFDNCDFIYKSGKTNVVKLYRDAKFVNCDFEDEFLFSDANKDIAVVFEGGSWGTGTIKDHFMEDSFSYNMDVTFDGDAWYWNTTTDKWEDK